MNENSKKETPFPVFGGHAILLYSVDNIVESDVYYHTSKVNRRSL